MYKVQQVPVVSINNKIFLWKKTIIIRVCILFYIFNKKYYVTITTDDRVKN